MPETVAQPATASENPLPHSPCAGSPRFTAANAKEMSAKGHEAKRQRKLAALKAAEDEPVILPASQYVNKRLARVRKQLDRIDEMMMRESDPQKLDRLASAQTRLSEQERTLAMRPAPGSLRPRGTTTPTVTGY